MVLGFGKNIVLENIHFPVQSKFVKKSKT